MAVLRKVGSTYVICFRLAGRQYQRSLRTGDRRRVDVLLAAAESRLGRLALGDVTLVTGSTPSRTY